jgi:hypothetical protein
MNECQKRPINGIIVTHAHKWKDDKQISYMKMMTKKQK